tara:strand:+ start:132 stop:437 length:306 start_codon:yes stop_codon:yes gene_type:complete
MIDPIKNAGGFANPAVTEHKSSVAVNEHKIGGSEPKPTNAKSVDMDLSIGKAVNDLSNEPPVDMALVNNIKVRVEEGRYPIDLDLVTDKLIESFQEATAKD